MNWPTFTITHWSDFVGFVEKLGIGEKRDPSWYLRGQADARWSLEPSLCRYLHHTLITHEKAYGIEFGAFHRFQAHAHLFLNEPHIQNNRWNWVVWWMIMQHYSCPTRLLDWTESPYVALYFAVEQLPECDGAVWLVPSSQLDTLMSAKYGKMRETGENPFFEDQPSQAVYPIVTAKHTERSVAQQGVFTVPTDPLADQARSIAEVFNQAGKAQALAKIVVPAPLKYQFMSRLRIMNTTASSLFPGIDGIGRATAEYIRLRVWSDLSNDT